jgi:Yip1 domain
MTSSELLRRVIEGYTAPRRSIRRLLDGGNGLEAALVFLALAFLVEAMLAIVFGGRGGASVSVYLINVALQLAVFFLLSGLVYAIGRAAGGEGTLAGAQLAVGWHALVTSPMTPLTLPIAYAFRAPPEAAGAPEIQIPAGGMFLAFVYAAISFWLMANYVAELHQFRNTWGVLGALVGMTFVCGMVLASVAGALAR